MTTTDPAALARAKEMFAEADYLGRVEELAVATEAGNPTIGTLVLVTAEGQVRVSMDARTVARLHAGAATLLRMVGS